MVVFFVGVECLEFLVEFLGDGDEADGFVVVWVVDGVGGVHFLFSGVVAALLPWCGSGRILVNHSLSVAITDSTKSSASSVGELVLWRVSVMDFNSRCRR